MRCQQTNIYDDKDMWNPATRSLEAGNRDAMGSLKQSESPQDAPT